MSAKPDPGMMRRMMGIILNATTQARSKLASMMGLDPTNRDLNKECGYPSEATPDLYKAWFDREGLATRVVNVYPNECMAEYPDVRETEDENVTTPFELAVESMMAEQVSEEGDLAEGELNPMHHLHRVDQLSGIGRFGVLLLGLDDGNLLEQPVRGFNDRGQRAQGRPANKPIKLLYLRAFDESLVTIAKLDNDPYSKRFGRPLAYQIKFTRSEDGQPLLTTPTTFEERQVHWTRVLHVADNRTSSEVYGVPRLQPVLNRLYDCRKVLGGSAEMFWKGAFPGYAFESHPNTAGLEVELDHEAIKDEMQNFMNNLQRYLTGENGTWKMLAPAVADPSNHMTQQLQIVCSTIDVPLRIFLGSEAGHLASTQDILTWRMRVARRQRMYLEPMLIRPFFNRLIALGVLPKPAKVLIKWKDLNVATDKDQADVGMKRTQSLLQYVTSGAFLMYRPRYYLVNILKHTALEADAIIKQAGGEEAIVAALKETMKQARQPQSGPPKDGTKKRNAN